MRRTISANRSVSSLVIAEHNGTNLLPGTLSAVKAALDIGGSVNLLVAGHNVSAVAAKAAGVKGVSKVLTLDNKAFANPVAEDLAKATLSIVKNYTHVLAPSSNVGKNFIPRLAAVLDSSPLTDISAVVSADTFKKPTYAGSAISTFKMSDPIKVSLFLYQCYFACVLFDSSCVIVFVFFVLFCAVSARSIHCI